MFAELTNFIKAMLRRERVYCEVENVFEKYVTFAFADRIVTVSSMRELYDLVARYVVREYVFYPENATFLLTCRGKLLQSNKSLCDYVFCDDVNYLHLSFCMSSGGASLPQNIAVANEKLILQHPDVDLEVIRVQADDSDNSKEDGDAQERAWREFNRIVDPMLRRFNAMREQKAQEAADRAESDIKFPWFKAEDMPDDNEAVTEFIEKCYLAYHYYAGPTLPLYFFFYVCIFF